MKIAKLLTAASRSLLRNTTTPTAKNSHRSTPETQRGRKSFAFIMAVLVTMASSQQFVTGQTSSETVVSGAPVNSGAAVPVIPTTNNNQVVAGNPVTVAPVNSSVAPTPIPIEIIYPPYLVTSDSTNGLLISLNRVGYWRAPTGTIWIPQTVGFVDPTTATAMGCTTVNTVQPQTGAWGTQITCPFVRKSWNGAYCNNGVANLFCLLYPAAQYSEYLFTATMSGSTLMSTQATLSFPIQLDRTPENESGSIESEDLSIYLTDADGRSAETITTTYALATTVVNAKELGWFDRKNQVKVQTPVYCDANNGGPQLGILLGSCHPTKAETIAYEVLVGAAIMIVCPFAPIAALADAGSVAVEAADAFNSVATFLPEAALEDNSFIYPAVSISSAP